MDTVKRTDGEKVTVAMHALESLAEIWAQEANLPHIVDVITHDAKKVEALLRESFMEGGYRGFCAGKDIGLAEAARSSSETEAGYWEHRIAWLADSLMDMRDEKEDLEVIHEAERQLEHLLENWRCERTHPDDIKVPILRFNPAEIRPMTEAENSNLNAVYRKLTKKAAAPAEEMRAAQHEEWHTIIDGNSGEVCIQCESAKLTAEHFASREDRQS